ncbi:hypothetical protein GS421_10510 [Rhodococcus hoagii]|nr:hypothetical protein [Prescottella equi]
MTESGGGIARTTGVVAVATVASRATGFLRTVALAAVLGTAAVGDAYNGANGLPNMVYELLLGGVLSSVLVPALARARMRAPRTRACLRSDCCWPPPLCRDRDGRCGAGRSVRRAGTGAGPGAVAVGHDAGVSAPAGDRLPHHRRDGDCGTERLRQLRPGGVGARRQQRRRARRSSRLRAAAGPVTLTPTSMTTAQILVLGIGTTAGIGAQAAWTVRRCAGPAFGGVGGCGRCRTRCGRCESGRA